MAEQTPDLREQIAEVLMRSHGMDDYEVAGAVMAVVSPEVERLDDLLREANEDGFGWKPRAEAAEAEVERLREERDEAKRALARFTCWICGGGPVTAHNSALHDEEATDDT